MQARVVDIPTVEAPRTGASGGGGGASATTAAGASVAGAAGASVASAGGASAGTVAIEIPVLGMTCAACQAGVQRALQRTPGVADASVSLMMQNAVVQFDPSQTTPARLVQV